MRLRSPERLSREHRLDAFACRHDSLRKWLVERAIRNQEEGASNCFVACDMAGNGMNVVGYYALAAGSIVRASATGRLRRNMPDPIPVAVLGRLAVHSAFEGRGIGSGLLKDAVLRCLGVARQGPGIRAILCHAIDDEARRFYLHHGFAQSPLEPMTLMLGLDDLARRLAEG